MDGTREERMYDCQNWRGDIVNHLKSTGGTSCGVAETARYSSYGVPFGFPPGDVDGDGDVDDDDNTNWPGSYQVRCDYDLDGDMDVTDQNLTITNYGRVLGRGVLSHSSVANRRGFCGYEHDGVVDTLAHVRHRVLHSDLGRWVTRDPFDQADCVNLVTYVDNRPLTRIDPLGLRSFDAQPSSTDCSPTTQVFDENGTAPRASRCVHAGCTKRTPCVVSICSSTVRAVDNPGSQDPCNGNGRVVRYTRDDGYYYDRCVTCSGYCGMSVACGFYGAYDPGGGGWSFEACKCPDEE